jgi:DNA-binding beta-propeller fold protein YncE
MPHVTTHRWPCATIVGALLTAVTHAQEAAPLVLETSIALGVVQGRIDHLAVDLGRQRLFVAELGNDSVGVVDLHRRRVLQRLTGMSKPQGVGFSEASDELFVANGGDGSLRIFGGDALKARGVIQLGDDADNVRTTNKPARVIVGYGGGALAIIDPATRRRLPDIPLRNHPEGFEAIRDGRQVLVNVPGSAEVAVIDVSKARQITSWRLEDARRNYPLAFDPASQTAWVATREPPRLIGLNADSGVRIFDAASCDDPDDVMVDAKRQRLYVVCGAGFIDTWELKSGGYALIDHLATSAGARTGLLVPALDRLYLAVRATPQAAAVIRVYRPSGAAHGH